MKLYWNGNGKKIYGNHLVMTWNSLHDGIIYTLKSFDEYRDPQWKILLYIFVPDTSWQGREPSFHESLMP